jgi:hypothetical protein
MANIAASCTINTSMTAGGRDKAVYMLILRSGLNGEGDVWSIESAPFEAWVK